MCPGVYISRCSRGVRRIERPILKITTNMTYFSADGFHEKASPLIIYADESYELALRLMEKAEHICLVVRSLSSEVKLEPKILIEKPVVA